MAYPQGAVVLAEDPFGNTAMRPYLICSNSRVPFHGEEYLAAIVTTTAREEAIELTDERFEAGRLPRQSYISPWAILTLKEWMITVVARRKPTRSRVGGSRHEVLQPPQSGYPTPIAY